jgi:Immunity protein Imm1
MIAFNFNGAELHPSSTEEVGRLLDRVDQVREFELWASAPNGPSLCMLRNGDDAWLMYLRQEGDSGFSSRSFVHCAGTVTFRLCNGQVDEYPRSWCIDIEQCYKALAYFFENAGAKPDWIDWNED